MGEPQGELVVPPLLLDLLPQPRVLLVQLLLHLQNSKEGRIFNISLKQSVRKEPTTDTVAGHNFSLHSIQDIAYITEELLLPIGALAFHKTTY